ncbi:MAG: hypothetical protein DI551_05585, partial [Micavibrio aeruginosavorus]
MTLQAHNNIVLNDTTIQATGANRLALTLTADSDANGSGSIALGSVNIATKNGAINFNKAITLTGDNVWNAGTGTVTTGSTVNMGGSNLTITGNNATIGGNISGTGNSVLTFKPGAVGTTFGLASGSGTFTLDTTEMGYLNPGKKLVIGDALGTGTGSFDINSLDFTGKNYEVEIYGGDMYITGLTQGDGKMSIFGNDMSIDTLRLGNADFLAYGRKQSADNAVITVQNDIIKTGTSASTVTLKADDNVTGPGAFGITTTGGLMNLILWMDADNTANDGTFNHQGTIRTNGGNLYLVGGLDDGANGGVAADGIGDGYAGASSILWGVDYNTAGGNILFRAQGGSADHGFYIGNNSKIITSSTGNINIYGIAGNANDKQGVYIANSEIFAHDGKITIEGTNARSRTYGTGVYLEGANNIHTDGATGGDIEITGTRTGTTGGWSYGIELYSAGGSIHTVNGNVILTGTGTTSTNGVHAAGIHSWQDFSIYSTGSGDITLNATASGTTGTISDIWTASTGVLSIGDANGTGDIIFNANTIDFANTGTTIQTKGDMTVKPRTASQTIGLGGGTGDLNLTDAELGYFNGAGKLIIGDAADGTGDIDLNSWNYSAKGYSGIEIYGNDIDIGGMTMGTGDFSAFAKDNGGDLGSITVSASLDKSVSGGSKLNLLADENIVFDDNANITAATGSLNILLNADRDADQNGAVHIQNSAIVTNGGYFVAGGGSGTLFGADGIYGTADDAASTGADKVLAYGNGSYTRGVSLYNGDISTGAGVLILNGHGYDDAGGSQLNGLIIENGSVLQTSSGHIIMTGTGGNGNNDNDGILIMGAGTSVSSVSGNITATGTATTVGAGWDNLQGVTVFNGALVETTGTGSIDFTGTASNSTSRIGVSVEHNNAIVRATGGGNISFTGNSNGGIDVEVANGSVSTSGGGDIGDITFETDSINLNNAAVSAADMLLIKPRTASTSIGLGGGSGDLNLTDTELGYLSADTLIIGDATNGTGDIDIDTWDLSGKAHNVEVYGNDIYLGGITLGTGDFLAYAKNNGVDLADLHITDSILKSIIGISDLDLRADNSISDNGFNITSSTGKLNISMIADYENDGAGNINFGANSIDTNGGDLVIDGDVGLSGNNTWDAGEGLLTTSGEIALNTRNLRMIADDMDIGDEISGTGSSVLTIESKTLSQNMNLGGGAGGLDLD